MPSPTANSASQPRADLTSLIDWLKAAQHIPEMFRRSLAEDSARRLLTRLASRLVKILAEIRKLNPHQK